MNGPVKTWTFYEEKELIRLSKKYQILKPESVVSENIGHHNTHIYLQHRIIKR